MALPRPTPNNEAVVCGFYADVSTAGSAFLPAPVHGLLVRAYTSISAAITTANSTWTIEINGVAQTGTGTITQSGSAAGDVDEVIFSNPATVTPGDTIEFVFAGESDTTSIAHCAAVIRT